MENIKIDLRKDGMVEVDRSGSGLQKSKQSIKKQFNNNNNNFINANRSNY
jgi:hypothetical protein